jgi:hypothetical protein
MPDSPPTIPDPFAALDRAAVARTLSQLADRRGDLADAWFERVEEVELPSEEGGGSAERGGPGVRVRREEGLAVRLVRDGQTWLSARDGIASAGFADALRQVARVLPAAAYPEPVLDMPPWDEPFEAAEVLELPSLVHRAVRARHAAFSLRLTVRRHRRWVQVVGGERLVPDGERESFYSCEAELPWCRWGALFPQLGRATAERVAEALVDLFRARHAAPPQPVRGTVVLAPAAAAVLLHEAVAHALEADLLALGGNPEAAVGVVLGPPCLSVLDDPAAAPEPVRRATDDEGRPVRRRWLLREGVVHEPLADGLWAAASEVLTPGAGRRAGRHALPGPRSTHLELLAGELGAADLAAEAEGGLWFTEAGRGALDPLSGTFRLELPSGRRIHGGAPADPVGPCRIEGRVADLLAAVAGVGDTPESAGAGWCAKGGNKLPVWATCPALRLEGVEVVS